MSPLSLSDGELSVDLSGYDTSSVAVGRIKVDVAGYSSDSARPWHSVRSQVTRVAFDADFSGFGVTNLAYWFYSCTSLSSVTGWANVRGLASVRQCMNGCTGLAALDLTGLDPSALRDYFYMLAGCTNLVTVLVDPTWALASGASGMGTFYNCRSIVGGNGTTYSSSAYGYARAVIDREGQVGYLTAGSQQSF